MSAALMPDALPSPDTVLPQLAQVSGSAGSLGGTFERFARAQRGTSRVLAGLVLLLLGLLAVQVWRASQVDARQLRLHGTLVELNQLSSRAEQAESALISFRSAGNSALLRSAQPCAGHCLSAAALVQAAPPEVSAVAHLLTRVEHWSGKVDQALLELGSGLQSAARGHEIADDAISYAVRELRDNLLALESGLLDLLADSESTRRREALILLLLVGSLVVVALGGLMLTHRRSQRLATAGLQAEQSLRELSLRDPLTGLPNRRALGMRLEHMIERAERHGGGPAVLALDLDGFKRMNDFYGHAAGDAALVELAKRLSGVLRKSDLPARVGGDEFVVLLDEPDSPEIARAVAERLLLALRAPVDLPAPIGPVELGVSVGLAHYPACGRTAQSLLGAADDACQAAKLAGKNRLFESRPPSVPPASRAA